MMTTFHLVAFEKIQPYCSQCWSALVYVYDANDVDYHPCDIRTVICYGCGQQQIVRFNRPVIDQKELV